MNWLGSSGNMKLLEEWDWQSYCRADQYAIIMRWESNTLSPIGCEF